MTTTKYDDLLSPIQPASPTASVSGYLTAVRGPDPVWGRRIDRNSVMTVPSGSANEPPET